MDKTVNKWADEVLSARVEDTNNRTLHEAGSPNEDELQLYRKLYQESKTSEGQKRALVLGMTPGLRHTLHKDELEVICVDVSEYAIKRFQDWIPESERERETVIKGNWLDVDSLIDDPVDVVVGDGVFANLLSAKENIELLSKLKKVITPDGVMVFRNILVPNNFQLSDFSVENRLALLREGSLSAPEFGFDFRIWAFYEKAYEQNTHCLNSKIVFEQCDELLGNNLISERENEIIRHYFFDGRRFKR